MHGCVHAWRKYNYICSCIPAGVMASLVPVRK